MEDNLIEKLSEESIPIRAYNDLGISCQLKVFPEDFIVNEQLGFRPLGYGHQQYFYIEKKQLTTDAIIRYLASWRQCPKPEVGYAGLKDKQAVTRQWFSVPIKHGKPMELTDFNFPGARVLGSSFHPKKIKIGQLACNRFTLTLRSIMSKTTNSELDEYGKSQIAERLQNISKTGVPNYFGSQRFGYNNENIKTAYDILFMRRRCRDRFKKGLALSAARSAVFNMLLAQRVSGGSWKRLLPGDPGWNFSDSLSDTLYPTGVLWGRGRNLAQFLTLSVEQDILKPVESWLYALEHSGLHQDRRSLVAPVMDLTSNWLDSSTLKISFTLSPGQYATEVVQEISTTCKSTKF